MKKGIEFCTSILPAMLRDEGLATIKNYQSQNDEVVLVTASLDIWVEPFAKSHHIKLISTKAEFSQGKFTGSFSGKNCNREEKAIRIRQEFDLSTFSEIVAYGDSSGDDAMFDLAHNTYFKPFRN